MKDISVISLEEAKEIIVTAKVEGEKIVDAKFKTFGCGSAIASSSMATSMIIGKNVEEALGYERRAIGANDSKNCRRNGDRSRTARHQSAKH